MSRPRRPRRQSKTKPARPREGDRSEPHATEAITVAWTAAVTSTFFCNLVTIFAHFYAESHPESKVATPFAAIMLLTAAVMGIAALSLLPVVWTTSRLKPPLGFVVFAALVAAAPVIVVAARLLMH